jgi:hypothetical protein
MTPSTICFAIAALLFAIDMICVSWAGARVFFAIGEKGATVGGTVGVILLCYSLPLFYTADAVQLFQGGSVLFGLVILAAAFGYVIEHRKVVLSFYGRVASVSLAFVWREVLHLVIIVHNVVVMVFELVTQRKHAHA